MDEGELGLFPDKVALVLVPFTYYNRHNRHKNADVSTLEILYSMTEFGGLRKHEKTQHALKSNS